jgi:hypothetical protein
MKIGNFNYKLFLFSIHIIYDTKFTIIYPVSESDYSNGNTNSLQRVIEPYPQAERPTPGIVTRLRNAMIKGLESIFYK